MQTSHVQRAVVDRASDTRSRRRLVARRDFRLLWFGEGISLLGDQLHLVALTWLALDITGSAAILGSILAAAMLARASCMLLAGVVVDRVSPRRVMVVINGLRATLGFALTVLIILDLLSVWQLYLFGIGFGLLDAYFQPAFLAIPPLLVADDELPLANALLQATRRACEMLGPALGGIVLMIGGAGAAFGIDAVTFAVAATLFATIRGDAHQLAHRVSPIVGRGGKEGWRLLQDLGQGVRAVARDGVLRILVLGVAVVNLLVAGPLAVGLPVLARTRFAADPLAFGLLLSAFGGGALVGTLISGSSQRAGRWWQWLTGALGTFGGCFLLISRAPSAPMAALAVALAGAGAGFVLVLIFTRFQQQSAVDMRGRMMSVLVFASLTCAALSNALAGVVAQRDAGLLFAVGGGLLLCLMVGFGVSRTVRMIE